MRGASGPTVDLVVVPSSYGDAPEDRAENLELAQQRTDQIDAICDTVVRAPFTGCTATLAVLLDRADALDPANSAALRSPGTDGVYILGGDQGIAMDVLAESPAETALTAAFDAWRRRRRHQRRRRRRVALDDQRLRRRPRAGRGLAPQQHADVVGRRRRPRARACAFGSQKAIFDQHFYQRGRFGRLLSTLATSDDRYQGRSLLGVGVDYATGLEAQDDRRLTNVFGASSAAVLDLETLRATHRWVGPDQLLSARHVLVHLLTPGAVSYDLRSRSVEVAGRTVPDPRCGPGRCRRSRAMPRSTSAATSPVTSPPARCLTS